MPQLHSHQLTLLEGEVMAIVTIGVDLAKNVVGDALSELTHLDARIKQYDQYIEQSAKEDAQAKQLMQLSGIGATTASAIVATVGKGHDLACGRQFCAWLGLVPGQYSSGGQAAPWSHYQGW